MNQDTKRLRGLEPLAAVQAWLDGEFGIGDEPALLAAICKDTRVDLSDEGIADAIFETMNEKLDAKSCLACLVALSESR
jgi:hypothetical protein